MSKTFTKYEAMKNIVSTTSTNSINQIEITVPLKEDQEDEDLLLDILDKIDIIESKLDTILKICDRISRNL
jgi:hypothetical protein